MSLLRTSAPVFSTVRAAAARRTLMTSTVRRTDDPRVLNKDTHSGASVKADKHDKDPKTLQKETAQAANQSGSGSGSSSGAPTDSEDAVRGEKHSKSPEQLQKETAQKHQS
ncbi:uncharacterized protein PSANT_05840 [Moesziomyces antarcticus]|nr:uncharacterized protein PSANT_05840 [Moesziomyces antarcticus]